MKITATLENNPNKHIVVVHTDDVAQEITISGKPNGLGSSVNGGELLCLALATCFCNDLYREARKRNIQLTKVGVEASAEFPAEGAAGQNITYRAIVEGEASDEEIAALIQHTDQVSEIQNTLRSGVSVSLVQ